MFKVRDVTINRKPVEHRFIYVTIQIGWHAKKIAIQLGVRSLYNRMSEGNLLSLETFRWCFLFILPLYSAC